jgi:hypothetical protein
MEKSGRKTANACDKSAKDNSMDDAAHFVFAAKNTFIEDRASLCNRAANRRSDTSPSTRLRACVQGQPLAHLSFREPSAGHFGLPEVPLCGEDRVHAD